MRVNARVCVCVVVARPHVLGARQPEEYWSLHAARIDTYLLEKTRVVFQASGEGNFHVLYAVLSQGAAYRLEPAGHRYLEAAWLDKPHTFEVAKAHTHATTHTRHRFGLHAFVYLPFRI